MFYNLLKISHVTLLFPKCQQWISNSSHFKFYRILNYISLYIENLFLFKTWTHLGNSLQFLRNIINIDTKSSEWFRILTILNSFYNYLKRHLDSEICCLSNCYLSQQRESYLGKNKNNPIVLINLSFLWYLPQLYITQRTN